VCDGRRHCAAKEHHISFPTDAKLLHAAIKGLNRLARKHGVGLRQWYACIAKRANTRNWSFSTSSSKAMT
jgi:hypothetical protein